MKSGLLIHEGQLTYRSEGMHKVLDLGEWWLERTGLPLPLGGNVIKRDLGRETIERVSQDIRKSIQYGLDHREEAMSYALQFSRGLDTHMVDRFIEMYVNDLTLDYGPEGREGRAATLQGSLREGELFPIWSMWSSCSLTSTMDRRNAQTSGGPVLQRSIPAPDETAIP